MQAAPAIPNGVLALVHVAISSTGDDVPDVRTVHIHAIVVKVVVVLVADRHHVRARAAPVVLLQAGARTLHDGIVVHGGIVLGFTTLQTFVGTSIGAVSSSRCLS